MLYTTLKFIHIFLAIVAIGFNATYGIWIARAARQPEHLGHVLRGIKFLDDRFANPAYALLLLTGLGMVALSPLALTTFWIAAALVLWLIAVLLGFFLYTPTLRKQIETLERDGAESPAFEQLSRRGTLAGLVTMVPVLLILFLMVFKPTL